MKVLLAAVLLSLVPTVGWAGAWGKGCSFTGTAAGVVGTPSNSNRQLSHDEFGCYRYVTADGVHIFGPIIVTAPRGTLYFDPDLFQIVITTATVIPHICPQGAPVEPGAADMVESCQSLGGANGAVSLDGTEGPASLQNSRIPLGPGVYYLEINNTCLGGDTCQVAIHAEGDES